MDVQMPEMDGLEAVRRIRADARFADLPVIALTAHAMSGDAEEFIAQGMSGYIAKPFRPHELFSTVEEWATDAFDPRDKDAVDDR
jgi:two-component system sensor histidine kinase/response regulator